MLFGLADCRGAMFHAPVALHIRTVSTSQSHERTTKHRYRVLVTHTDAASGSDDGPRRHFVAMLYRWKALSVGIYV
ncbi:hypothetical protein TgHK011_004838 [Trichoderma gracile]|nr:hypothetical protein TgHK011_004838 [Trichoderma gracile]